MSNDAKPEAAPSAPSASPIPLVLGVINLAMSGFLIFHAIKAPKIVQVAAAAETEGEGKGAKEKDDAPGPTVTFDPLVINLNEPGSNRYLKTSFDVEVLDKKTEDLVTERKKVVRDEVLSYLSGLNVAATLGEENKAKIKEALLAKADHVCGGKGKVRGIFFNEFVVQ
jgi:flagellar basal body-associated protein FliL